jgi:uncharacterized Zn finger protein
MKENFNGEDTMRVTNIKKEYRTTGLVESESQPGAFYKVTFENGQITCTCPHHTKAGAHCKHIEAFKAELDFMRDQRSQEQ